MLCCISFIIIGLPSFKNHKKKEKNNINKIIRLNVSAEYLFIKPHKNMFHIKTYISCNNVIFIHTN